MSEVLCFWVVRLCVCGSVDPEVRWHDIQNQWMELHSTLDDDEVQVTDKMISF